MSMFSNCPAPGPLGDLSRLRQYRGMRISSWDRAGGNRDFITLAPGEIRPLAEISGAGAIRYIWITVSSREEHDLRKLVLRMFWDGEQHPSVEVPLGDFFGCGHAQWHHFVSLPLSVIGGPGGGQYKGLNCYFPMPFASGARIEVENQGEEPVMSFYYHLNCDRYEELEPGHGRFHAWWNREDPCQAVAFASPEEEINLTGEENYTILQAEGQGQYVGCVLSVDNALTEWFGEGDDMIFVDGEPWPPSYHGTGTEDYFGAAWGFPSGAYAGPFTGVSVAGNLENWSGKWSVYRFHLEDPIPFERSIRVTIEHGHANNQGNDYSSVAYWYQEEPHRPFGANDQWRSSPPPAE